MCGHSVSLAREWERASGNVGKYKGDTSGRAWQITGTASYCIPSRMGSMPTDWQDGVDILSFLLLCADESRAKMSSREQCVLP